MQPLLPIFMYLAGLGLILSVIVHVSSLLGMPSPFGEITWYLHIGIFIVWIPAVIVCQKLVKDFPQKDYWKAALRACPTWMRNMAYFFFGYAILNFCIFIISDSLSGGAAKNHGDTLSREVRGFSGHWMIFYSMAMAILYSAIHVEENDDTRRCINGHPVSPSANYCEKCGATIMQQRKIK
jgi:hypothetical protein